MANPSSVEIHATYPTAPAPAQFSRPSADTGAGYVVEYIDWYRCVLPDGVVPSNQDGEVAQFRLMDPQEVLSRLEQEEFTTEAALILVRAGL